MQNCLYSVCLKKNGDPRCELFNQGHSPRGLKWPDLPMRQTRQSLQRAPSLLGFMTSFGKRLPLTGPRFQSLEQEASAPQEVKNQTSGSDKREPTIYYAI